MQTNTDIRTDLVLVGGGHSHVAVLKRFAMRPVAGVRLTLVARELLAPYSGMLPGLVAGHYTPDEAHVDLQRLARYSGTRILHAEATGLNLAARRLELAGRAPLHFDLLSLDLGSRPSLDAIESGAEHICGIKPIDHFRARWDELEQLCLKRAGRIRIAIIGAGAGGSELALAIRHRLAQLLERAGLEAGSARVILFAAESEPVASHAPAVRARVARQLETHGVELHLRHKVVAVGSGPGGKVVTAEALLPGGGAGERTMLTSCDLVIATTHAAAPDWPRAAGLAVDDAGFVRVEPTLQAVGTPFVFASGDVASFTARALPKSGVYAVRQGPVLAENLARFAAGRQLRAYRPQRRTLALISTGEKSAVASWGPFSTEGPRVWRFKNWLDRRWIRRYQELPPMEEEAEGAGEQVAHGNTSGSADNTLSPAALAMRCGGCGSKVSSAVLRRALDRLAATAAATPHPDVLSGWRDHDDAAVLRLPPGKLLVQSVDHFRTFVDDPFLFGRITANHCLSDLYAMGATPHTAQAMVTLPYGEPAKVEEELFQLLSGVVHTLEEAGATLVGGHTAEGPECALGLSVNGLADDAAVLAKGGARVGDRLVLAKALGTGVIFAADMRAEAPASAVEAALASMLQSNAPAARIVRDAGATSCTDVTGFGLLGHLIEMLRASDADAELDLAAVPRLPGADALLAEGFRSSLHAANVTFAEALELGGGERAASEEEVALLCDPQTSGGLLASVPAERATECVNALADAGFVAACIGTVRGSATPGGGRVRLGNFEG